jgi:oligosaccharide repeat unit polymerase
MPAITDFFCWCAWVLCVVTSLVLFLSDRHNPLVWLSPIRWLAIGFLVLHVIAPFNILWFGELPHGISGGEGFIPMALASALGGLAFWVGWHSKRHLLQMWLPVTPLPNRRQFFLQILVALPLALASLIVLFQSYGGWSAFVSEITPAYYLIGSDFFNIFTLLVASFVPLTVLVLILALSGHPLRRLWWAVITIIVFIIHFLIAVKLAERFRIFFTFLSGFAVLISFQQKRIIWRALILLVVSCLLFYTIGNIRYGVTLNPDDVRERIATNFANQERGLYHNIFMNGDFDAFQNGMVLFYLVPQVKPLMLGSTFISVLYNPIPRAIWPEKPTPSISQYLVTGGYGPAFGGHVNFAVSLIAELYVNFWWIGIAVGMLILGWIAARLWNWFLDNRYRVEAWFHIGLFCAYLPLVLRGSFHCMTVYYLMIVVTEVLIRKMSYFLFDVSYRERSKG